MLRLRRLLRLDRHLRAVGLDHHQPGALEDRLRIDARLLATRFFAPRLLDGRAGRVVARRVHRASLGRRDFLRTPAVLLDARFLLLQAALFQLVDAPLLRHDRVRRLLVAPRLAAVAVAVASAASTTPATVLFAIALRAWRLLTFEARRLLAFEAWRLVAFGAGLLLEELRRLALRALLLRAALRTRATILTRAAVRTWAAVRAPLISLPVALAIALLPLALLAVAAALLEPAVLLAVAAASIAAAAFTPAVAARVAAALPLVVAPRALVAPSVALAALL